MMTAALIHALQNFFSSKPVEKAWLFGSFIRGEERPDSDIDIMVRLKHDVTVGFGYFRMIDDLQSLCNRRVDLVDEEMIDPHIVNDVASERVLIYERSA